MKEFSIEQKAKAYDEALKVLHKYDGANIMFTQDLKEEMFPELKESEDEKIRKAIIEIVKKDEERIGVNAHLKKIQWLEKQYEHSKFRDSIQVGDKVTRNEDGVLVNLSQLKRIAKPAEVQGKQNLVKIPKFKIGDTIKFKGLGHNRYTIKDVCGTSHYINTSNARMDMSYTDANFELVEKKPIEPQQDMLSQEKYAKAVDECIYGKHMPADKVEPKFHEGDMIIHKELGGDYIHNPHKIIQVDILDKKYRLEGGLVAHFDEQDDYELVEQKSAWSDEDEKIYAATIFALAGFMGNEDKIDWLKSIKYRVQSQPKLEWSKEDENMIEAIDALCDDKIRFTEFKDIEEYAYKIKNWLKSIKYRILPQNTWKPSDKQIEALLKLEEMHVLEHEKNQENAHLYMVVKSIREQLSKLRDGKL